MDEWLRWIGGVIAAAIMGLIGVVWTMFGARMSKQDVRMDGIEAAMKEKADKEELGRQRDSIAKIFDELKEVREDINQKHIATLEAIHSYFPGRR